MHPRCTALFTVRISLREQRDRRGQLSAEFAQFQFVISIYDQVTTSPEKEASHGNTDTYCCVNYSASTGPSNICFMFFFNAFQ